MRIDLNSDLGEGFGPWSMGDDAAMLGVVTSANIACGGHASDPDTMFAIVDFAYNLGTGRLQTSTLKRKINANDWEGAKEQLMLWTKGGGKVLPGLLKRRKAECTLLD